MTATSRPLRALGVMLGGWAAVRVVMLWPAGGVAVLPLRYITRPPVMASTASVPVDRVISPNTDQHAAMAASRSMNESRPKPASSPIRHLQQPVPDVPWLRADDQRDGVTTWRNTQSSPAANPHPVVPGFPGAAPHNRFSGSAWTLLRAESAPSLASGGQLGGSQIGFRLFYTPGPLAFALTTRISAPLTQPAGREAAIGVAVRGRNIGIIAEQRIALDRSGRDTPAVFAYAGVYDVNLPGGLTLDGYAQAGIVGLKSPATFGDGALRIERVLLRAEKASLALGAGLWGGAQPGVSRVDIGPQLVARAPIADTTLRVSAEWRQRIAGSAAPASGPSVTVGFDF